MIEVIGALLGFAGGIVPDLFGIWRDKQDRQHELTIMKLQMEQAAQGHQQRLREIDTQADIAESKAIYKTYSTGIRWIDAYNGTVRPTLAYAFFLLYAMVKVGLFMTIDFSTVEGIREFWDDYDRAFLFGVISYYFGQRGMAKVLRL